MPSIGRLQEPAHGRVEGGEMTVTFLPTAKDLSKAGTLLCPQANPDAVFIAYRGTQDEPTVPIAIWEGSSVGGAAQTVADETLTVFAYGLKFPAGTMVTIWWIGDILAQPIGNYIFPSALANAKAVAPIGTTTYGDLSFALDAAFSTYGDIDAYRAVH